MLPRLKKLNSLLQNFPNQSQLRFLPLTILVIWLTLQTPIYSAEKIKFNFGLLGFQIKVADLELFVQQGKVTKNLNFYLKRFAPEQKDKLQNFFQQSYDLNPRLVYRFAHTSVGKRMLNRLGDFVQIPENINGFYALRAAILTTATSSEAANPLNLLQNFPTDIKLNLKEILALVKQIKRTETATENLINTLTERESKLAHQPENNPQTDFSEFGKFAVVKQTINFYDPDRDRNLITDLYLPKQLSNNTPIILVSNGLGAKRTRFAELGNYLATYGFAVVIPEHPGTNYQRQKEFIQGLHRENFDAEDYLNRPLDISFILDSLNAINEAQFSGRLEPNNAGIFGYSIGGSTALSLTGAKLDFSQLERDCQQDIDLTNISILYQCRALEIKHRHLSLQDKRIKAAFLFVPFGKSLFSPDSLNQITTPMLWQVVDRDFLTSLTKEQIPMYHALKKSNSYFVISENLPHSTATLSKQRSVSQQNESRIAKKYQNILSLIFFQTFIGNNLKYSDYSDYLEPNFMQNLTEAQYKLHITQEIPQIDESS